MSISSSETLPLPEKMPSSRREKDVITLLPKKTSSHACCLQQSRGLL
jgi:hypothetical protein